MDRMSGPRLSSETEWRVTFLFPPDRREQVRALLQEECGNNLPFCQNFDESEMDRIRFSVLKLSDGDLNQLQKAIGLANTDWRDLLVAAGFANDIKLHYSWLPERKW
jgi:hypothetical protein